MSSKLQEYFDLEDEWLSHPMAFIDEELALEYTTKLGEIYKNLTSEEKQQTIERHHI